MTIWLVRHAHARTRRVWDGDDTDRPLSDRGDRTAVALAGALADAPVAAVLSSPAQRCIATVLPLAGAGGLDVETVPALAEGRPAADALRVLLDRAESAEANGGDIVACSHGDTIPGVLRLLAGAGMRAGTVDVVEKGSIWRLDSSGRSVSTGTYLGVPT